MTSAKECREFGTECLAWAKAAGSDQERQAFLQIARAWLYAAASLEGRLTGHSAEGRRPGPSSLISRSLTASLLIRSRQSSSDVSLDVNARTLPTYGVA